uniref:Uncharacterized protein n=1 Tax=Anguilla anguilla TaxID=7936 RepID=A0A0E9UIV3_ANGAN
MKTISPIVGALTSFSCCTLTQFTCLKITVKCASVPGPLYIDAFS